MTSAERKIIHIDMDCFYAAVEMRDNPELRGKPVGVGGSPTGRGVLCTANYEARKFGVRSAMATATALRKCPELILTPVNMSKYKHESAEIRKIFADYTDLIEPLSLDEAYLDVSHCAKQHGSATLIAQEIRQRIEKQLHLTASAGISVNKFIAKVASDWNKPNGQFVVAPNEVDAFVEQLAVGKIFGVGKVTEKKMHRLGLKTCGDIRQWDEKRLSQHFGSFGSRLHQLSYGIDNRPVKNKRSRKSISVEHTYSQDLPNQLALLEKLPALLDELEKRAAKSCQDEYQIAGLFVKVKFADFTQTTVAKSGKRDWIMEPLFTDFRELLNQGSQRQAKPVRLLGVGFRLTPKAEPDSAQPLLL